MKTKRFFISLVCTLFFWQASPTNAHAMSKKKIAFLGAVGVVCATAYKETIEKYWQELGGIAGVTAAAYGIGKFFKKGAAKVTPTPLKSEPPTLESEGSDSESNTPSE